MKVLPGLLGIMGPVAMCGVFAMQLAGCTETSNATPAGASTVRVREATMALRAVIGPNLLSRPRRELTTARRSGC